MAKNEIADYEIVSQEAPNPVGLYPHARRYGDLVFVSGMGPRKKDSPTIPGVELDSEGKVLHYDIRIQTQSVIDNLELVLKEEGLGLQDVLDIHVFLTNMKADFKTFNEVYAENFGEFRPTRTTVEVLSLPTPIAVEFKVIARAHRRN